MCTAWSQIHGIIEMLAEGRVPSDWVDSNIIPLYKGGDKENPLNYRPVSLTNVIAKIYEKMVKDRWIKNLKENGLVKDKQFFFI